MSAPTFTLSAGDDGRPSRTWPLRNGRFRKPKWVKERKRLKKKEVTWGAAHIKGAVVGRQRRKKSQHLGGRS